MYPEILIQHQCVSILNVSHSQSTGCIQCTSSFDVLRASLWVCQLTPASLTLWKTGVEAETTACTIQQERYIIINHLYEDKICSTLLPWQIISCSHTLPSLLLWRIQQHNDGQNAFHVCLMKQSKVLLSKQTAEHNAPTQICSQCRALSIIQLHVPDRSWDNDALT